MTGYQIQNKNDGTNAFNGEKEQHFETLEEARSWADAIWEQEEVLNAEADEDERTSKDDFVVAYYERGVHRGDFPLFI